MTRRETSRPAGIAYVGAALLALSALTSAIQLWGPVGLLVVAGGLAAAWVVMVHLDRRTIRVFADRTVAAGFPVFGAAMGPSGGELHLHPDRIEFVGRRGHSVAFPWDEVVEVSLARSSGQTGLLLVRAGDGRLLELEVADRSRLAEALQVRAPLLPGTLDIAEG